MYICTEYLMADITDLVKFSMHNLSTKNTKLRYYLYS